jgi:hypothetical protein
VNDELLELVNSETRYVGQQMVLDAVRPNLASDTETCRVRHRDVISARRLYRSKGWGHGRRNDEKIMGSRTSTSSCGERLGGTY